MFGCPMSNENYRKCRTCRFARHDGNGWACMPEGTPTDNDGTCGRYRPGCCENCNHFSDGVCKKSGDEVYELDVCDFYDPSGSF